MDAKITLSFNEDIIRKAKVYAEKQNISLSRLMEMILDRITSKNYQSLEDLPIADWVNELSEGKVNYGTKTKNRKTLKRDFFEKNK